MQKGFEESIAKDMERWFKKKGFKCRFCGGILKCDTINIDHCQLKSVRCVCKKCGFAILDEVTTKSVIEEVKIAYSHNKKTADKIINFLKNGMKKGMILKGKEVIVLD